MSEALNYAKEMEGKIDPLYGSSVEAAYRDDFTFLDMLSEMPNETDNASALSNEQLKRVCEQLGVPDELNVEISQDPPVYWEAGECWTIYVTVYHAGAMVAAANVDLDTAEPVKDIWQYTPAESISGTAVGIDAREEESTTGIGEGIAIPHGKCDAVTAKHGFRKMSTIL